MPLLAFWNSNPRAVDELSIEQVVASAGDGVLKDGSLCSQELRQYFAEIPSAKLASYVEHCLSVSFAKGGLVLQDLINELGRRLDYEVKNGRYQGTSNAIGYDGIWESPEGHTIILEVKTTDAYRISLDTIAGYRERLKSEDQIRGRSSVLMVVGREDTGELEAQVRGSRHAWDIRLISADSLIKLVQLKENADGPDTGLKIRSILAPMEYTRLDRMIDVMFTAARDVETAVAADEEEIESEGGPPTTQEKDVTKGVWQFTDSGVLQQKRQLIISSFGRERGIAFVQKSRALSWDSSHHRRVACTVSKRYAKPASYPYWYAYHPQWDEFLREGEEGFLILGCMDLSHAYALPWKVVHDCVDALNTTTTKEGRIYWHIHLSEISPGRYVMLLPKKSSTLALEQFRVALASNAEPELQTHASG